MTPMARLETYTRDAATVLPPHGVTRVARREGVGDWGEYWHFTTQSKRRLVRAQKPLDA